MSKTLVTQTNSFKLAADTTFVGLYAQAVSLVLEPDFLALSTAQIALCPSSLRRHAPDQFVPARYFMSLPSILEELAWGEIRISWQSPNSTARAEALELCLAALALEWQVELSCADAVLPLLQREQEGTRGFLSLPLFGLDLLSISQAASARLPATALILPWQIAKEPTHYPVVI